MSSCSLWCYKSCQIQPDCADYNWRAKDYCFKAEDSFHGIFDFPEEPKHQVTQVGKPLKISPFIQKGDFTQAVQLSKVFLQEKAAEKVENYAAFITVKQRTQLWSQKQRFWTSSEMFYWFIPAENGAVDKPLIIWLQVHNFGDLLILWL